MKIKIKITLIIVVIDIYIFSWWFYASAMDWDLFHLKSLEELLTMPWSFLNYFMNDGIIRPILQPILGQNVFGFIFYKHEYVFDIAINIVVFYFIGFGIYRIKKSKEPKANNY